MFHHGLEKLSDIDGFTSFIIDNYFNFLPFEHAYWTYLAAYTQIIGSVCLILGIFTRLSLTGLCSTMLFAMIFHLKDTGLQGAPLSIVEAHNYEFEASFLYLLIYVVLLVIGTGQYSLSEFLRKRLPISIFRFTV